MNENVPMNATLPIKEELAQKLDNKINQHRAVIEKYKGMNEELIAFKKKSEESIKKHKEELIAEKEKTEKALQQLTRTCEETILKKTMEKNISIAKIKESPLFEVESINALKKQTAAIRSQNVNIRANFDQSFKDLMTELRSNKAVALDICREMCLCSDDRSIYEIRERVSQLKSKINEKCLQVQKKVNLVNCSVPQKLAIEQTDSVDDYVQNYIQSNTQKTEVSYAKIGNQQVYYVSNFLALWCRDNADWLSK
ncbi:hypothetical protein TRFO_13133 [Tritrichomonas foetus]|uniref:Uncharacterized protein n=1 Tax=Tritrichomonas foetus TaxID=1144522 RepID=A0A1J4L3L7_9EUKA|nr:hypothetical protein TRFO_13133 [Tritrichomonas foetus]|eukprot:OHT16542.1 hypothetical protein TRFO_13133 [Tritrichomonas foetus]